MGSPTDMVKLAAEELFFREQVCRYFSSPADIARGTILEIQRQTKRRRRSMSPKVASTVPVEGVHGRFQQALKKFGAD